MWIYFEKFKNIIEGKIIVGYNEVRLVGVGRYIELVNY